MDNRDKANWIRRHIKEISHDLLSSIYDEAWEEIEGRYDDQNWIAEDYMNRPEVHAGWHQQDVIDMYRRER